MTTRKNRLKWFGVMVLLASLAYIGVYLFLYSIKDEQANAYRSSPLPPTFRYHFDEPVEEFRIKTPKAGMLNALLFKSPRAKGVICFWKGGGGTLANWGAIAPRFLQHGYDVLVTDYRQHGKSTGVISLANFYTDAQTVYDTLKRRYPENHIVICGYSLGGRVAAHLAATNRPKFTLLIDPSSSGGDFSDRFTDLLFFPLPSVTGFTFRTEEDVQHAPSPVVVVSTDNAHSTAYQLRPLLTKKDYFLAVPEATHATILNHPQTLQVVKQLLLSTKPFK